MGIATGEVFAFPEGRLYLYASASGTASGSGIGFAEGAQLQATIGWRETFAHGGRPRRVETGRRVDLTINSLFGDLTLVRLAQASAAVNARFEGLVTGGRIQSAHLALYSGVIDSFTLTQQDGELFRANYAMHAHTWSAFGG